MILNNPQLFSDPHIHYPLLSTSLSFSDYTEQCKTLIKNNRLDLQTQSEHIIDMNAPFEWYPQNSGSGKKIKYGALLIHGLLDSPFTMRDIGTVLQNEGLLVRAILLPGHGTIPGALLSIDYLQWVDTLRYAIETLANEVEHIFLVGYSTGGALALYHKTHSANIAGIIALAPALKINCPLDFLARWPTILSKRCPRLAWFHRDKSETLDYAKYRSTPFNAVHQVYQLAKKIEQSQAPHCPLFFVLPANDVTVMSKTSIRYFKEHNNPKNRMILYDKHNTNPYNDNRIIVRSSQYPEMHISDFSHLSIPFQSQNPHYGIHGDYAEASRSEIKNRLYGEFFPTEIMLHNILYQLKLARYQHNRLTYNPDFTFMSHQIKDFIHSIFL
jgi:esterase/lipase